MSSSAASRKRDAAAAELAELERETARIDCMTGPEALGALDDLCERWLLTPATSGATLEQTVAAAFGNFDGALLQSSLEDESSGGAGGSDGMRRLLHKIREHENTSLSLFNRLRTLGLFDGSGDDAGDGDGSGGDVGAHRRMVKCLESLWYAKKVVVSAYQARSAVWAHHLGDDVGPLDQDLDQQLSSWSIRFRWIDTEAVNPMQKLLLFLLDAAQERKYRKQAGICWEPIVVDGHDTHAWKQVCEIKDFVHSMISKELCWEQWVNATAGNKNISSAVEYLSSCVDLQFPDLRKKRGVFSFQNGVYVAPDDRFYWFDDAANRLGDGVVACKFFDTDLPRELETASWQSIQTPYLDSIMSYQGWPPEVCHWLYVLLGRLLYALNDRDSWQVIPFFKGMASSGKSTIVLKVAKQFFEGVDVGVLSNNIEKKFGLSAFSDKYLFVAPEIKSDLQIEQAEFQSMVSGEDIQVRC